jgi:hypothetical protein
MNADPTRSRMTQLALTFPCLRGAPGVDPFEPGELDRWAAGGASHGERVTARFLLAVWDASGEWAAGRFDVMEALRVRPPSHSRPFLAWAEEPWWA